MQVQISEKKNQVSSPVKFSIFIFMINEVKHCIPNNESFIKGLEQSHKNTSFRLSSNRDFISIHTVPYTKQVHRLIVADKASHLEPFYSETILRRLGSINNLAWLLHKITKGSNYKS